MSTGHLPRFLPELLPLQPPQHALADACDEASAGHQRSMQALALYVILTQFEVSRREYAGLDRSQPYRAEEYLAEVVSSCLRRIDASRRAWYESHRHCTAAACLADRAALLSALRRNIYRINSAYSPTPLPLIRLQEFAPDPYQSRHSCWPGVEDIDLKSLLESR